MSWILPALFFPILTCTFFVPDKYEPTYTNTIYSADGKSLTIYLDGKVPVSEQNRALGKELAIAGHDYFEVAFWHPRSVTSLSPNGTIARASWELREAAGISGVFRTETGIDYGFVSDFNSGGPLSADEGAAILFVGKKIDKTLLAIGKLVDVFNEGDPDGLPPSTIVTAKTVSVTFAVDALKCGVIFPETQNSGSWVTPAGSSFLTAAKDSGGGYTDVSAPNTEVTIFNIAGKDFPLFKLVENKIVKAQYTFDVTSSASFDDYSGGIILAGEASFGKRQPRYPIKNGEFQSYSLRLDDRTEIAPVNNNPGTGYDPVLAPAALENPLLFEFNTAGTLNGSVFALVFEAPVYPLSADGDPGTWYMRASYDSYFLDLDDGKGGTGGAVLIGTGEIVAGGSSGYLIKVVTPPIKWQYNDTNHGLDFNITGLEVMLYDAVTHEEKRLINNSELFFELAYSSIVPGSNINSHLYGLQTVFVHYRESGIIYTDIYNIVCDSSTFNFTNIPTGNFMNIEVAPNTTIFNSGSSQTFVLVATQNWNFPNYSTWISGGPHLIMIVAAKPWPNYPAPNTTPDPTIIIGRSNTSPIMGSGGATNHAFFFGRWPFTPTITVGGTVYEPCDYILNAGGSFTEVTVTPGDPPTASPPLPAVTGYFLQVQASPPNNPRFYLVTEADGVTILNDDRLY